MLKQKRQWICMFNNINSNIERDTLMSHITANSLTTGNSC